MSFLIYLFVLLIGAASVLFGLDLLNSPLHPPPNVTIGRSIRQVATAPAAHEAKFKSETNPDTQKHAVAESRRKSAKKQKRADNREFRPTFPTSLEAPQELAMTGDATADETAMTKSHDVAVSAKSDADERAKPDVRQDAAQANDEMTSANTALAADSGDPQKRESPHAQNSCNVRACEEAYRSFRASDCTYQPNHGPRLLCTRSDGADAASMAHAPRRSARRRARSDERSGVTQIVRAGPPGPVRRQVRLDDELSETARIVRQMTRGRDLGDIVVQRADGTIIVVHTGDERAEQR